MKAGLVVLLLLSLLGVSLALPVKIQESFKQMSGQLAHVESQLMKRKAEVNPETKCIICGIVVNEIQGFVAENITETEIEDRLKKGICNHLGLITSDCDELVDLLPELIDEINKGHPVSVVCVNKGYCTAPIIDGPDPLPVPSYSINLDLPAQIRWVEICKNPQYQYNMKAILGALRSLFPDGGVAAGDLGKLLNLEYLPGELAGELQGCALAMGVDVGWLTWFNLGYEVTDGCTSIIAQTPAGKIIHARNMDFWDGIWATDHLKNLTIQVDYKKGGKTLFQATTFAGYVGVLSGMRPNAFSISIDTRYYPEGIGQLFEEVIVMLTEKNASLVSFLTRQVLTKETNYAAALKNLANDLLVADVYYILGGVSANQGAVISRNRDNASDIWTLDAPNRWFEVETNYDHWKQPPWFDDRVVPANNAMTAIGPKNISLDIIFKNVLSLKPVFNLQTTFTVLASAADGTYKSFVRNCQFPCVE